MHDNSTARGIGSDTPGADSAAPVTRSGSERPFRSRETSIQTQLSLGVGLILVLATLIALTGYVSLRSLQTGIQTTLQEASQIRESSLQIENNFLLARQAEAAFLDTWRTAGGQALQTSYVSDTQKYLAAADAELDTIGGLVSAAHDPELRAIQTDLESLAPQFNAYQTAFLTAVARIQERSQTGGTDSALRGELDFLETALEAQPGNFTNRILQIRVNEQAYFNSARQEYVDNVHLRLSDLAAQIDAAEWTTLQVGNQIVSKAGLQNHVDTYRALFDRIVLMEREINIKTVVFREVTADIDRIAERIAEQSQAGLVRAESRLATTARSTSYVLGLTAVLALAFGGVVAVVLSRRIVRPIGQLSRAAERMGAGKMDQPVAIRGAAELMTLAESFNTMAGRLTEMIGSLEQRVAERTRGLQAAAEVSRATTSVLDLNELIRQVVDLVRERFELYYVGLFLVETKADEGSTRFGQIAVLRAGTGRAGQQMVTHAHRLPVGGESMIGWCIAHNQARIALDVGADPVRFVNPLLPDTRSEMALPLRSRGRVIGAMTVQSVRAAAFDEADVAVMQTMADQVAVAIDNARLFAETQATLDEMAATQRHYLGQAWREYTRQLGASRYEAGQPGSVPAGTVQAEIHQALAQRRGMPVIGQGYSALVAPILLRGQIVGVLRVQDNEPGRRWTDEEMALVEAVGERLALAADNLRLLDESQGRAARERLTREITARLRETLDVNVVLDTAVDEIGRALGLAALDLRLGADSEGAAQKGSLPHGITRKRSL